MALRYASRASPPIPSVSVVAAAVVICCLGLIEVGKRWFYRQVAAQGGPHRGLRRQRGLADRIQRRSARFSTAHALGAGASRGRRPA